MISRNIIGLVSIILLVILGMAATVISKQSGITGLFTAFGNKPYLTVEDQFVTS